MREHRHHEYRSQPKKEQILRLAHVDPFVCISDTAAVVKTTSLCAHRPLGTWRLLAKLRRDHARSMASDGSLVALLRPKKPGITQVVAQPQKWYG